MKRTKAPCFLLFWLVFAVQLGSLEYNSVPLGHAAYDLIQMGIIRGIIFPPSSVKPWPLSAVQQKLWEMIDNPMLSSQEADTVARVLDALEQSPGIVPQEGRFRAENDGVPFEAGIGWESSFSVGAPDAPIAGSNMASVYARGGAADFASWNIDVHGGFVYIKQDRSSPFFPHSFSRQWDGGVFSLANPVGWTSDPSLAYSVEGELNAVFFNRRLQLRLGRIRRDWGPGSNEASLFFNARSHPFAAIEGTVSPFAWLNVSFLHGALERSQTASGVQPSTAATDAVFTNMLSATQIRFQPSQYVLVSVGGSAIWLRHINMAFFSHVELRLPRLLQAWGSFFADQLHLSQEDFFGMNSNNYAFQLGTTATIRWLPFGVFTLRYTKIEPYCYANTHTASAFVNGGASLGHYMPPNSDELLLRIESRPLPNVKAYVQFQRMRHGADFGYGAVPGSSLWDRLTDTDTLKYFLMDGVYRWDDVIKVGGEWNIRLRTAPVTVYAETGVALTRFTINGSAGVGNEAEYEPLNDEVYRERDGFVFSIGFRLFR